jgi:type II secretory pathway component GspD/PulD (secretin)
MRIRLQLLTATLTLLAVPFTANAQARPPAPAVAATTTTTTTVAPAAEAPLDFSVKDAPASAPAKSATGKETLTVDFNDEEIRVILRDVAELFDLNMVIPDALQGKTSVKLHDVNWHQILQVVLSPVGYTFVEDGNIIKIVSNESMNQEPVSTEIFVINYAKAADIQPTLATLVEAAAGGKIVIDARTNSLVITERPSRMKRIRPVIDQLDRPTDQVMIESKFVEIANNDIKNIGVNWSSLSGYNVTATPGAGGLYSYSNAYGSGVTTTNGLTGGTSGSSNTNTGTTLNNGTQATSSVSTANGVTTTAGSTSPSSSIANNAGTTVTNAINTGTALANTMTTTGAASNAIAAVFSADQFRLVLSALQQLNTAKIVSNPTIVTLNNSEASINVGQQYPIPNYQFNQQTGTFEVAGFNYKDIGIILKVTPQVNSRGFIKLTLAPEVSQNQGTTSFGGASGASIPIIGTRKAITQVSLKDGYTMGIGGLISTNFNQGTNKIPILGDLPIIGYLFKQDSKNDTVDNLVIFITAKTISAEGAPVEQIFNSEEVRAFHMKKTDLPGYRDGSDPFIDDSPAPKKLKGMD